MLDFNLKLTAFFGEDDRWLIDFYTYHLFFIKPSIIVYGRYRWLYKNINLQRAHHRAMSLDPWTCDQDMVSTKNLLPSYTYYVYNIYIYIYIFIFILYINIIYIYYEL